MVVGGTGAVGRPLTSWLREKYGIEATVVNSKTGDLEVGVKGAEVLISCVGKPGLITETMIDPATVVIDVGSPKGDMTREVYQKASMALPVPGGVGPVTIACLMQNIEEGCATSNA